VIRSIQNAIELRDPVHGAIAVRRGELAVIDSLEFQRLRGVKQLGFAEFVFPGAVHNRYLHSIGAMHIAGEVMTRALHSVVGDGVALDARARELLIQAARLAALLHDVGHPPLSHAAESLLPRRGDVFGAGCEGPERLASHEDMTLAILTLGGLGRILDVSFEDLGLTAADVAAVISDVDPCRPAFVAAGVDFGPLLHAMVSGELDVDRMDYLLRDSYFTGVGYGTYDRPWLVSNVRVVIRDGRAALGLDTRALAAFEHFLLARYHMFQMVYYHSISDSYDACLRGWLDAEGDSVRLPSDLDAFALCTDAWLWERLARSSNTYARQIVDRSPPRLVVELRDEADQRLRPRIDAAMDAAGVPLLWRTAKPVLSRYALAANASTAHPLLAVESRPTAGPARVRPISEVTDLFGRYRQAIRIERAYVEAPHRDAARRVLKELSLESI